MSNTRQTAFDVFVVGGGINGSGIARDAAGRGLRVGLAEMGDLASATSSASTKLFHGGLRYLEYFEVNLVKHALAEREVLLRAMPHISWPMRFVLPYHPEMRFEGSTPASRLLNTVMPWMKGRRPAWMVRLGLFFYDRLGGRDLLPATSTLTLNGTPEGAPLQDRFARAFEYSDCWIEDSRLVVLNARDAEARGAHVMTRTKVVSAQRSAEQWEIVLEDQTNQKRSHVTARMLVNAAGPWVGDVIQQKLRLNSSENVRLVRGSHIVTHKLFEHDKSYFLQGTDGRIIFAIPYETDFTLIGTTDAEHEDPQTVPQCTEAERDYLIDFINSYFKQRIGPEDVVWSYSGVRPLYDDGATSATAATRDYVLKVDNASGAPILNIFGGKITTYRKLAEDAMEKICPFFDSDAGHWTAGVPLPGGDFAVDDFEALVARLQSEHAFLAPATARRLLRAYGTESWDILNGATTSEALGQAFAAGLSAREVDWLWRHEYARTAEDVLWRRSKLGLRFAPKDVAVLDAYMQSLEDTPQSSAAE